jgi:prepilin-type processing-associated H-X9-DG protein
MTKKAKFPSTVGCIVLLIFLCAGVPLVILITGLQSARTSAQHTVCATNLKAIGNAATTYALMFSDQLPSFSTPSGSWMCDQPAEWASLSRVGGIPEANFAKWNYCPASTNQDQATLWGGPTATYRITGYVWTNERAGMPPLVGIRTPHAPTDPPDIDYHDKFAIARKASQTELALDWVISDKPDAATASWTGFTATGRSGIYDTSHMNRNTPGGANVLAFDGHVEWRPFDPAKATPVPQSPTGPVFWIPGN